MSTNVLILKLLGEHDLLTSPQIASRLNIPKDTARCAMTRLRKTKHVHIGGWTERGPGRPIQRWRLGDAPDVPPPKPETTTQRNKRKWKAMKADPVRYTDRLIKNRLKCRRYYRRTRADTPAGPVADPFAALFDS